MVFGDLACGLVMALMDPRQSQWLIWECGYDPINVLKVISSMYRLVYADPPGRRMLSVWHLLLHWTWQTCKSVCCRLPQATMKEASPAQSKVNTGSKMRPEKHREGLVVPWSHHTWRQSLSFLLCETLYLPIVQTTFLRAKIEDCHGIPPFYARTFCKQAFPMLF